MVGELEKKYKLLSEEPMNGRTCCVLTHRYYSTFFFLFTGRCTLNVVFLCVCTFEVLLHSYARSSTYKTCACRLNQLYL